MNPELQDTLVNALLGIIPVISTAAIGYFANGGIKNYIIRTIISAAVTELATNVVPNLKSENQQKHPEIGYDLTPMQGSIVRQEAAIIVTNRVKELDAALPTILKPVMKLESYVPKALALKDKINAEVKKRKLKSGKAFS